jgi:hypothetical protein
VTRGRRSPALRQLVRDEMIILPCCFRLRNTSKRSSVSCGVPAAARQDEIFAPR